MKRTIDDHFDLPPEPVTLRPSIFNFINLWRMELAAYWIQQVVSGKFLDVYHYESGSWNLDKESPNIIPYVAVFAGKDLPYLDMHACTTNIGSIHICSLMHEPVIGFPKNKQGKPVFI